VSTHIQNLIRRARAASNEHTQKDIAYISRVSSRQIRSLIAELTDALVGYQIGPAACRVCGEQVEPGDQAHHLRSAHPGAHVFFHDMREYSTDRPSMTVAEIKEMVLCSPSYQFYEERDENNIAFSDGEAVPLTDRPHFYSVPPATY
jgi:hypothetical protein